MPDIRTSMLRTGSLFVMAAAIAACGGTTATGGTTVSAGPVETAAATASAPPSPLSSAIPEATPSPSVVVPTLSADTPLVDVLPAELGGAPTQKVSLVGSDLSALDPSAAMIFGSLQEILGADGADMTIGVASNARASVIAIRVAGKSAQDITDAMVAARTLNAATTKDELDLGGKHVLRVTTTISPLPFYMYATGDVSFTVAGADESIVAEALSKLP